MHIAEHPSRIELGVMLTSLAEVAQTHAKRNESEKVFPVVGVDNRYLWSRAAENADDVVEAEDDDGDLAWTKLTRRVKFSHRRRQLIVDGQWIQATNREI